MDLCDLNTIRLLLGRHGFRFSRSMGQNFLIEGWVPDGLVEGAGVSLQNGVPQLSEVHVTEDSLTITTHDADTWATVDSFTIYKSSAN